MCVEEERSEHSYVTLEHLGKMVESGELPPDAYVVAKCMALSRPDADFLFDVRGKVVWVGSYVSAYKRSFCKESTCNYQCRSI